MIIGGKMDGIDVRKIVQGMIAQGVIVPPKAPHVRTAAEEMAYQAQRREERREAMRKLRERRKAPFPAHCVAIPESIADHFESFLPYERKVLTAICRATFGPRATVSAVTLSKLQELTRMSQSAILSGLTGLKKDGWIVEVTEFHITGYRLHEKFSARP